MMPLRKLLCLMHSQYKCLTLWTNTHTEKKAELNPDSLEMPMSSCFSANEKSYLTSLQSITSSFKQNIKKTYEEYFLVLTTHFQV